LSKIDKELLAIPTTSTPSERAFSLCRKIFEEHRSRFSPDTLEKLLFLKYNFDF